MVLEDTGTWYLQVLVLPDTGTVRYWYCKTLVLSDTGTARSTGYCQVLELVRHQGAPRSKPKCFFKSISRFESFGATKWIERVSFLMFLDNSLIETVFFRTLLGQ